MLPVAELTNESCIEADQKTLKIEKNYLILHRCTSNQCKSKDGEAEVDYFNGF